MNRRDFLTPETGAENDPQVVTPAYNQLVSNHLLGSIMSLTLRSARGDDRLTVTGNQLVKLVEELHRENVVSGGDGNNPGVVDVRRRIAEFVRADSNNASTTGRAQRPANRIGIADPPAYELDS